MVQEGEKTEQGIKKRGEEIMIENIPNLVKEKDTQVQEEKSHKQNKPKEAHTKLYHNKNGKG